MARNRKRTNPQDMSKLTRNSQVKIRLTTDEVTILKAAAATAGMCMADYVMSCVHNRPIVVVPGAHELRHELLLEGKNLNMALRLAYDARKNGREVDLQSVENAVAKVAAGVEKLDELMLDLKTRV